VSPLGHGAALPPRPPPATDPHPLGWSAGGGPGVERGDRPPTPPTLNKRSLINDPPNPATIRTLVRWWRGRGGAGGLPDVTRAALTRAFMGTGRVTNPHTFNKCRGAIYA